MINDLSQAQVTERVLGAIVSYKKTSGRDVNLDTLVQTVENALKVKEMRFFQDALCDVPLETLVRIYNECNKIKESTNGQSARGSKK